jgi:PD-(D/E)XK nuclease superfamily
MPKKATKKQPKTLPYCGWTPMKDGVSQSLLQKFVVDKDRAHKHIVLGLRETNRKEAMEYGTIYHKLIELGSGMGTKYTRPKLIKEFNEYVKRKFSSAESVLLARIALAQYHIYKEWEADKPRYTYIDQEPVFHERFTLPSLHFEPNEQIRIRIPSGITIPLRGRIDQVIEDSGMWIQENKTKSRIDISHIQDTLHANLQVMFYAVCSELKYGRPCKGVIYNVVRKPGQRQKQKESDTAYIDRIVSEIQNDRAYYFYRLSHTFSQGQVKKWTKEELLPLLYTVYLWWKSIERNPTDPWMDGNPFHGRKSFGIYDPMVLGKGDFYDLIVYGRKQNLVQVNELFPELQEDDEG